MEQKKKNRVKRLKTTRKKKMNENQGEECGSWERSTFPPCSTYNDIIFKAPQLKSTTVAVCME